MDSRRSRSKRPRAWFVPRAFRRFLEQSVEMRPIALRFVDPALEGAFRAAYYREILVSGSTYELLIGRFAFSEPTTVELKGKGPTSARFLLGRS